MSDVLLNFNTKKEPSVHIVFISQSEARYKANYYKLFSVKVKRRIGLHSAVKVHASWLQNPAGFAVPHSRAVRPLYWVHPLYPKKKKNIEVKNVVTSNFLRSMIRSLHSHQSP